MGLMNVKITILEAPHSTSLDPLAALLPPLESFKHSDLRWFFVAPATVALNMVVLLCKISSDFTTTLLDASSRLCETSSGVLTSDTWTTNLVFLTKERK